MKFKGILVEIDGRDLFIPYDELDFDLEDIYFTYNGKDYVIINGSSKVTLLS